MGSLWVTAWVLLMGADHPAATRGMVGMGLPMDSHQSWVGNG